MLEHTSAEGLWNRRSGRDLTDFKCQKLSDRLLRGPRQGRSIAVIPNTARRAPPAAKGSVVPVMLRLLFLLCTLAIASGQGFTNPKKPPAVARKEDIKYIKCQACEALAKNALRQVKAAREGLKPGKKVPCQSKFQARLTHEL